MSIGIPQGVMDHVQELCQEHGLFESGSTRLKEGWEDKIADIIKDSRFVVIGEEGELKDLSAVAVGSKSLSGRIFWGTLGVFTPSYWNSHYATEGEVRTIFRAVMEKLAPVSSEHFAEALLVSERTRLSVPRRAGGPAGRQAPSRTPFESRYQPPPPAVAHSKGAEAPSAEEMVARPMKPPPISVPKRPIMGTPSTASLAQAAIAQRGMLKQQQGGAATPSLSRAPTLNTVSDFEAALQSQNPSYATIASQLSTKPALQLMVARSKNIAPEKMKQLMAALAALKYQA